MSTDGSAAAPAGGGPAGDVLRGRECGDAAQATAQAGKDQAEAAQARIETLTGEVARLKAFERRG